MAQHQTKGAMNILQDNQLSIYNVLDFVVHYPIVTRLLTVFTAWGGKWNIMVKMIVWVTYLFLLWVPLCLGWRYATFFSASIVRLLTNKGGRKGLPINLFYVGAYIVIFWLVYIPYVLPYFGYHTGETVLEFLKVI